MNIVKTSAFVSHILKENMLCTSFSKVDLVTEVTFFKIFFFFFYFLPHCLLNLLGHHKTISSDCILCMNMGTEYYCSLFCSLPTVWHCIFHSIPSTTEIKIM